MDKEKGSSRRRQMRYPYLMKKRSSKSKNLPEEAHAKARCCSRCLCSVAPSLHPLLPRARGSCPRHSRLRPLRTAGHDERIPSAAEGRRSGGKRENVQGIWDLRRRGLENRPKGALPRGLSTI